MGAKWLFVPHGTTQESCRKNREIVAKHIGTHYRNRSKPLQKRKRPMIEHEPEQMHAEAVSTGASSVDSGLHISCLVSPKTSDVAHNPTQAQGHTVALRTRSPVVQETVQRVTITSSDEHQTDTLTSEFCPAPGSGYALQTMQPLLPPFGLSDTHVEWSSFALDFQINFIFPCVANWGSGPNIYSSAFAQMMLQDQLLFDAVAASAHAWYSLEVQHDAEPSLPVLWYRNRALRGLRERLKRIPTTNFEILVLVIFYMMENAARMGRTKDFRFHYAGLLRLRHLRGSHTPLTVGEMFSDQAIVILESSEIASTLRQSQKPSQNRLHYPDLPLRSPIRDAALALPFGLRRLAMEGCASAPVIEALRAIPSAEYWQNDLAPSQRHSLLVQRLRSLGQSSNLPIEKLLCLGALAFSLRLVVHMHLLPEMGFLQRIVKAGQRVQKSSEQLYRELNVWALTIAADLAASTNDKLRQEAQLALSNLRLQEFSWLRSWTDVETALKKFFFSDNFAVGWRACWESAFQSA